MKIIIIIIIASVLKNQMSYNFMYHTKKSMYHTADCKMCLPEYIVSLYANIETCNHIAKLRLDTTDPLCLIITCIHIKELSINPSSFIVQGVVWILFQKTLNLAYYCM